jgi:hypothetical protein
MNNRKIIRNLIGLASTALIARARNKGGAFKTMLQGGTEQQQEPFVPFYIEMNQHYSDDGGPLDGINRTNIFGPYKEKDAQKAFNKLVTEVRGMSSGQRAKTGGVSLTPNTLSEYLNRKHWLGSSEYKPMFILEGPAGYWNAQLTILDDDQSWALPSMSTISFYIWADNPNMEKNGNTFTIKLPQYRAGETINVQAPVFLNLWKDYLIGQIKRRFRFE